MSQLTPRQMAVFRRAVERRSRGQVRLPGLDLETAEAVALWQDLVTAFGQGGGRMLTPRECKTLRQRAWRRSAGHIGLIQARLSLQAGLALWRLAGRLEGLLARQPRSGLVRAAGITALGLAATQLAACTSFWGGNIKGSFACSAPGGTCAPSTVIDDQALAVIQNARPLAPGSNLRAAAYVPPRTRPYLQSARRMASASSGRVAAASPGMAHRERRILKVIFPSYVDGAGNFHEPRVVHTVADAGGWMQMSAGEQGSAASALDQAMVRGREPGTPAPAPAVSTDGLPGEPAPAVKAQDGMLPDPRAVAEARARGAVRAGLSPLDAIKADVEARLGATPGLLPAPPPPAPARAPGSEAPASYTPSSKPAEEGQGTKALETQPNATPPAPQPVVTNSPAPFPGRIEE